MFYDFYVKHFKLENHLSYGQGTDCNGILDLWPWKIGQGQRSRSLKIYETKHISPTVFSLWDVLHIWYAQVVTFQPIATRYIWTLNFDLSWIYSDLRHVQTHQTTDILRTPHTKSLPSATCPNSFTWYLKKRRKENATETEKTWSSRRTTGPFQGHPNSMKRHCHHDNYQGTVNI